MVEAGLCIRNEKGHVYDRFRERVMFPIINPSGNIIGFGGRILSGEGAKYMNSPESIVYDKGKNLFALNLAKKSDRGYFILVEGYMDVISLHQSGITAAVAGCGTVPEVARLEEICFSEPWSEKSILESLNAGTLFFVARIGDKICGYIGISIICKPVYTVICNRCKRRVFVIINIKGCST